MHTVKQPIVALALGALLSASAICSANGSSNGLGVVRVAAVHTRAHKPSFGEPDLRSSSVLIVDETHAATLYARRADAAMPIASITKLMTALVVMDAAQPLDEMIESSRVVIFCTWRSCLPRIEPRRRLGVITRAALLHSSRL